MQDSNQYGYKYGPEMQPQKISVQPDDGHKELEIARRQSLTLLSQQEELQSGKSTHKDVCLTTDTDHEYTGELTPTKARSRSLSTNRECGTQTDSRVTSGSTEKSFKSSSKKADDRADEKKGEKPKWGVSATREKKYVKQSEKDPMYQQKLKKREDRVRREKQVLQVVESGTESEVTLKSTPTVARKISLRKAKPEQTKAKPKEKVEKIKPKSDVQPKGEVFEVGFENPQGKPTEPQNIPKKRIPKPKPKKPPRIVEDPKIEDESENNVTISERPTSPPVPALLKKMQMGFVPDETGRLTSLSRMSNIPGITPEPVSSSIISVPSPTLPQSEQPEEYFDSYDENITTSAPSACLSRTSSAGKVDIEIAVSRNPHHSGRNGKNFQSIAEDTEYNNNGEASTIFNYEDTRYTEESSVHDDPFHWKRPDTRDSELSGQESLIYNLMQQGNIQEELSARETELSEKGIIEFNVRIPSRNGKSAFLGQEYRDPYICQRQKAYARNEWLKKDGNGPSSVLSHLSHLKRVRRKSIKLIVNQMG